MSLDQGLLAAFLTEETGLPFIGRSGFDAEKNRWVLVEPEGHVGPHGFAIRTTLRWRRLDIAFEPGTFAGGLLYGMSKADSDGRSLFESVISECVSLGATVSLRINATEADYRASATWPVEWTRFSLLLSRGNLELGADDGAQDEDIVRQWAARFSAAVVALLPLERTDTGEPDVTGYPEGSLIRIEVNRYERDRRNRSAALAIHGRTCKGCGMSFEESYGAVAAGFIEIHHTTPVSMLGPSYTLDVRKDLVPLCPNCHAVVHRRSPPLSIVELVATLRMRS
jgi:5-methylcytosine-specific restriction protein A